MSGQLAKLHGFSSDPRGLLVTPEVGERECSLLDLMVLGLWCKEH
jgi:hypothetical protein